MHYTEARCKYANEETIKIASFFIVLLNKIPHNDERAI